MATKFLYWCCAVLIGSLSLQLEAGDSLPGSTSSTGSFWTNSLVSPRIFSTQVINQSGPGVFPNRCARVTIGTNRFAFLVPDKFRVDTSMPQQTMVVSPDYTRNFTFRLSPAFASEATEVDADTCRSTLQNEHPRAVIVSESGICAANHSGLIYDLRWCPTTNIVRQARVAYIPSPSGILEFNMESSPDKAAEARSDLTFMLLTLRMSDLKGKLELPSLSNKF
jgi:hypothetical protein